MFIINSITINGTEYKDISGKSLHSITKQLKLLNPKVKKEKKVKVINQEDIIQKINTQDLSDNTKKSYIKSINALFRIGDLMDEELIIKYITEKYDNVSTIKAHLSALMKVYTLSKNDDKYKKVFEVFTNYKNETPIQKEAKPIKEAMTIMKDLKDKYKQLKKLITSKYDENRMYAFIGCLFLEHGVLRGDELINMYISPDTTTEYDNYINLKTKQMIIGKHKTVKKTGIRTINLSEKCIDLIKDFPKRFLITKKNGLLYNDATGFSKRLKVIFGNMNYTLRDAKSSINLKGVNSDVATSQGHSLETQITHYRKYK
jgi:hypothetical protein